MKFSLIVGLIVAVLLSGCTSMLAVKNYSSYSRTTITSVTPVAKDYYASCIRSNSYKPLFSHNNCDTEQNASKAILAVASVLDAYNAALGALASDELVDYSTDVDKLTDEMKKLNKLDTKQVDAVGKLSVLIANHATSAYQQNEVGKFIQASNESVVAVSNSLADLIEKHYSKAILLELDAWREGYRRVEQKERECKPIEWEIYSKLQWQQYSDLQTKLSAAKALANNIREIGKTHEKLKEDAENITGKEVYASVRTFVDATVPVINEVQEAFNKK